MISYYEPDIVTAQDYYPFGMMSRVSLPNNGKTYKFGFNGKLNDDEVKGMGNQQDYGMRIYDPRVGRFLSVDPITRLYPMLTPYQFSSNNPIENIDLDGLEGVSTTKGSAFIEGAKDGFLLTFTGHVSNGENAPKASVSNIPGKLGKALTLIKKIEDHIPDVPGLGMLKQVTLMESSANQALEVTYKAQQSGHSGWYATGLVGEKIFEAWAFKKIGGKVSSSRMGKLFSAPDPMTAEMSRPLTDPLPSLGKATSVIEEGFTRVGRWMSKTEYEAMKRTGKAQEGAGGQTFTSVNGYQDYMPKAKPGSVYAEFDVPTNSLVDGGLDGWFKMLAPSAKPSQQYLLNKQGGDHLPNVKNLSEILYKK